MVWYGALAGEGPARARPSIGVIVSGAFPPYLPGVMETAVATRGDGTMVEFRPSGKHRLEISWKGMESAGLRATIAAFLGVGTAHTYLSGVDGHDATAIEQFSEVEKNHVGEERLEISRKLSETRSRRGCMGRFRSDRDSS